MLPDAAGCTCRLTFQGIKPASPAIEEDQTGMLSVRQKSYSSDQLSTKEQEKGEPVGLPVATEIA
jgi:hypothetical protein